MANLEEQRKDLTRRIVNKIASDPKFREQMTNDPVEALSAAGFSKEVADLEASANNADVSGYAKPLWFDSWFCLG